LLRHRPEAVKLRISPGLLQSAFILNYKFYVMSNFELVVWTAAICFDISGLIYFGWESGVLIGKKTGPERFKAILFTVGWPFVFIGRVYDEVRKLQGKKAAAVILFVLCNAVAYANSGQYANYWDYLTDGQRFIIPLIGILGIAIFGSIGIKSYFKGTERIEEDLPGRPRTDTGRKLIGKGNPEMTVAILIFVALISYFLVTYFGEL
jgi:hypothetical protein